MGGAVQLYDYFKSDDIKTKLKTITYKKGEVILRPHDETKNIHMIGSGMVKIYNFDPRGKEYTAIFYGPGDLFPLAWIIDQDRPAIYFKAITETKIYLIDLEQFREHLKENTELMQAFLRKVAEQFSLFASTVNNLGLKYGRERIYYKLLVLASKFGEKKNGSIVIPYFSQSDLGATVNMTREGVSKEISKLEQLGIIDYARTGITIKDTEYLQRQLGEEIPLAFFDSF
jgi:CRP-like cAMP-binding protein